MDTYNFLLGLSLLLLGLLIILYPHDIDLYTCIKPALVKANKSGFEMVFVKGGTFTMGGNDHEHTGQGADECPHTVQVQDFSMGKYEVTQADWYEIMGYNPSYFKGCHDCPVEQVSWDEVNNFIQIVNVKYKEKYRLPTEAEWEFAARGGVKSKNYKFSGSNDINEVAWYASNSKGFMLFMVIETFHPDKVKLIYRRFEEKGRLLPEGVNYINSWIDVGITKCYQIMESDNKDLLLEWMQNWDDLMNFEVIPVLTSAQAKEKVMAT